MTRIYFDHNATTPPLPEVVEFLQTIVNQPMNPSSIHHEGRRATHIVEDARRDICQIFNIDLNTHSHSAIFTSSGTEANNMLFASHTDSAIIVSATEHSSVLEAARRYAKHLHILEVDANGIVKLDQLKATLQKHDHPCLVSIMAANNETGVIQPLAYITEIIRKYDAKLHSDCVQAPGKLALDGSELDYITTASHKCGGIAGTGVLIHKKHAKLKRFMEGGGQEKYMRGGTENVLSIASFGKAARWYNEHFAKRVLHITKLQNQLEQTILSFGLGAKIYGSQSQNGKLCNTSMIMMPGAKATQQLMRFDLEGFAVSAGSACSSGKIGQSHVLEAMGVPEDEISCSIRVSLSHSNTAEEIEKFTTLWHKIASTA